MKRGEIIDAGVFAVVGTVMYLIVGLTLRGLGLA